MPWLVIGAVVLGLWIGTDLRARLAVRLTEQTLRRITLFLVTSMALYMVYKARS
jgi:uncharacterized protein